MNAVPETADEPEDRRSIVVLLVVLALAVPPALWVLAGNGLPVLDPRAAPPGQWLYLISKLAALQSIALIGLQFGLVVAGPWLRRGRPRLWSSTGHRVLGVLILLGIGVHVGAFVAAAGIRNEALSLQPLLPLPGGGYYRTMIAVGAAALWLAVAGVLVRSGAVRAVALRHVHPCLMMTAAVLAIAHSYAIGSESGTVAAVVLYIGLLLLVAGSRRTQRTRARQRRILPGPGS